MRVIVSFFLLFVWRALGAQELPKTVDARPSEWVDIGARGIVVDLVYKRASFFSPVAAYPRSARAWATRCAASKLLVADALLRKRGYRLVICDAYRPFRVTIQMWNWTVKNRGDRALVAPPWLGSCHNRGAAVDAMVIALNDGSAEVLPSAVDDLRVATAGSKPTAASQALSACMKAAGMSRHPLEWWHFYCAECGRAEKIYNFSP